MASIKLKGDTSGELTIQAPSVAGTNTLNLPASSGTLATTAQASIGMKNRIINGNMMIDQRNAGASVTPADGNYTIDRWATIATAASKFSIQQNAGSVTPPVGFSNYLGITSLSAYSVGTGDILGIQQRIEGFNAANLNWGTADAKTVTLSAWVYSSLTGTFGGSLINAAQNYSYPFTYTISSANTWTKISITISGPTSGTWVGATNGVGIQVNFGIGGGSTYSGTAGAWGSQQKYTATGATSVVGTSGATFYITGVQLEVGTTATDFENLQYGQQLSLCLRYLPVVQATNYAATGMCFSATNARCTVQFPVPSRVSPTGFTTTGAISMTANNGGGTGSIVWANASTLMASLSATGLSGLVAGDATALLGNQSILFTGCEL